MNERGMVRQNHPRSATFLRLIAVTLVGACMASAVSLVLFGEVFFEGCDDLEYREVISSGLGPATFAAGGVLGVFTSLCLLAVPRRNHRAVLIAFFLGIGLIAFLFSVCCLIAAQAPISPVGLCWSFRPWWRASNWGYSALGFLLFVGPVLLVSCLSIGTAREPISDESLGTPGELRGRTA